MLPIPLCQYTFQMTSLELTLFFLLAAVLGVVIFRSFKLPPMLGYLAVGAVIGPHMMGMVQHSERIQHLAEFGVVFLMFVIGLEFSLPKLRTMKRHVFGLGLLQVLATMTLSTLIILGIRWIMPTLWHLSWQGAVALSGVLAMSSTAIVVKLMAERLELDTEYGKRVMGVLLFQDLAVVPLLVLIPALAANDDDLGMELLFATLKAVALIGLLLIGGQHLMKRWLFTVAQRKSSELFMLNILLITLGLAWLTEQAGLSLALGAFIAGMLISETPYKYQVESDIKPFHDLLLGLFFITIGMMLDWHEVVQHWEWVLVLITVPVLFKLVVVWGLAYILGGSNGVALRTGLYLAQAGEFGFVLLNLSLQTKLLPAPLFNAILASMVLSMIATPFIIMYSKGIVLRLAASEWMSESLQMTSIARQSMGQKGHVIICGYGRTGQSLARMLDKESIPHIALDLDPDRVRKASAAGEAVVYGDASRAQALTAAGLSRASAVVLTCLDVPLALHVLDQLRKLAPQIPVVVRTQDDRNLDVLRAAGATEVVPEAIEGSLMLAGHALALVGIPMRRVLRTVQQQREQRYRLLRGYFRGAHEELEEDDSEYEKLVTLVLADGLQCLGQTVDDVRPLLDKFSVHLVSVRRASGTSLSPRGDLILEPGDTLVLSGKQLDLAEVEDALCH